jgi:hypothetical protein
MDNDAKYEFIIKNLKQLQKVKAPDYFEANLIRKINSGKFGKETKSFWDRFLVPAKVIPSIVLAVTTIILLFVVNLSPEEDENPLLAKPRIREELISNTQSADIQPEALASKDIELNQNKYRTKAEKNAPLLVEKENAPSPSEAGLVLTGNVNKSSLNFRQVYMTDEQKAQLLKLKDKIKNLLNPKKK